MKLNYSSEPQNPDKAVSAMARDLDISFKDAVNISVKLKDMRLNDAIELMEAVIKLEKSVPYLRFQTGIGHRKGTHQAKIGKYPQKAALKAKAMLENLRSNAENKGLDTEKLRITHIQAQLGIGRVRRRPKGRWKMWTRQFVNLQAIAEEKKN
ncbi:MAG: 50S ribosomal protein L22 [Candidatus Altiarchaeota archaeon]